MISTLGQSGDAPCSELWLAAADGSTPPRRLTDGTALDSGPRWAPDSESIFFRSDRPDRRIPQLHRLRSASGAVTALTA
jgi:Tol biopolymer transport system component